MLADAIDCLRVERAYRLAQAEAAAKRRRG